MAAYKQTGVMPAKLANAPALPDGLEELWRKFLDLHSSRGSTMSGAARITFSDIDAYQRVTGTVIPPWQVNAIRRADDGYFAAQQEAG